MFTECTIMEIIKDLQLNKINDIILGERGSLIFNGMSFKENTLSFVIPDEREFYRLTDNEDATPVQNFCEENQFFSIRTRFGSVFFYNKDVDIDNLCDWDTQSKIFFFHEGYLRRKITTQGIEKLI